MTCWKLSAGTAGVIGRQKLKNEAPPTTAYIMIGEKCRNNCGFCAQARDSRAAANLLSRVTWPETPAGEAVTGVATAHAAGRLKRACLQVVNSADSRAEAIGAIAAINAHSPIPVCVSSAVATVGEAAELAAAGAERICIALDAATPEVYAAVKGGDWGAKRRLLTECAKALPGRMSTHLIVGLGETEQEMVATIASCIAQGITVGLFAFTPVRGTALADRQPPPLGHYRRVQAAHHLLRNRFSAGVIRYREGRIVGLDTPDLGRLLADGEAFRTSGCPDCNRPYYNERPGGVMYNYPRPLTKTEIDQAQKDCELDGVGP